MDASDCECVAIDSQGKMLKHTIDVQDRCAFDAGA